MKKLIILMACSIGLTSFAQEKSTFVSLEGKSTELYKLEVPSDSTNVKKNLDVYVSTSLSISNSSESTFDNTSYASVEVGLCKGDVSLGLVLGRGNINFKSKDVVSNYWYEAKVTQSFPIGKLDGFVLMGIGNYIDTQKVFVEYGGGLSYKPKKVTYFSQVSNWDGIWYVSPGIMFNL